MKVLVAIDGSYCSLTAADTVASRPWPPGSIVRLVYVDDSGGKATDLASEHTLAPFLPLPYPLEKARARFAGHAVQVETRVLHGHPKAAILDEAETWGADLIVVGSHGMSRLERFLLGSVSLAVATHSPCSVEIVRPKQPRQTERGPVLERDGGGQ